MKKTIRDYNLFQKKVLIRCDFNVPIKDGKIIDDTRIKESLQTIRYAALNKAKVILFSHLGKVKEEKDLVKNDLLKVSERLSELLEQKIIFVPHTRGEKLEKAINELNPGDILLVQNTRYEDLTDKKESKNDQELAKYWSSLGDIFINDAFGTIHRNHASNVGIATYLPSGIGFLVEKELKELSVLNNPIHPYVVILGGAKVNDKVGTILSLSKKADYILVGGGMALTFLASKNINVGSSLVDSDSLEFSKEILEKYKDKIILPLDLVVSSSIESSESKICLVGEMSKEEKAFDIGPKTVNLFKKYLMNAKTVMWNGPLGVYEKDLYKAGTFDILNMLTTLDCTVILGGGDIVAASAKANVKDKITHASTGGGATLEYLEGKSLPGLEVISERE